MSARRDFERFCKAMWLVPKFCWYEGKKTLFVNGPAARYQRTADGRETFEQMAAAALTEMKLGTQAAYETLRPNRITKEDIERMRDEA